MSIDISIVKIRLMNLYLFFLFLVKNVQYFFNIMEVREYSFEPLPFLLDFPHLESLVFYESPSITGSAGQLCRKCMLRRFQSLLIGRLTLGFELHHRQGVQRPGKPGNVREFRCK